MPRTIENLVIENAHIIFRNFAGRGSKYNREGDRNFSVIIDDEEMAEKLRNDGWNVTILKSRDPDEPVRYKMKVNVKFDDEHPRRNPLIVMHTKRKDTEMDSESVGDLDSADILNVDLIIRPYAWEVNDKSGVSAYLKTMHVVIEEDEFADKYAREEYPEE